MGDETPAGELAALKSLWRERGITVEDLDLEGSQSLDGASGLFQSGLTRSTGGAKLDEATARSLVHEELLLGRELGRGGMGIVHSAEQRTLRREVAVKRLDESAGDRALASLLKEAWVGGLLAHPNVAPVHALVDVDGLPAIVMKRIDGMSWRRALRDPSSIPPGDHEDALGFHVRVLVAVCNAVHHAHLRGALHLDLKPDNVMLGRFGEVSVVDWGLAAGWGEQAPSWLPRASEIRSVSGTPDYMTPEVAAGDAVQISPRTDVYLLGAMLHEIVTGEPPHRGGTALSRLLHAFRSAPASYRDDVPAGLVKVLHRAMHRDPSARYPSAEAFRDALEAFLRGRRAEARVVSAERRVGRLLEEVARQADEVEVARAFGAARFALNEAEEASPGHESLRPLPARLYECMARRAMDTGRLELAESYLRALPSPSSELLGRLERLRADDAARAARVARLEKLAHEHDLAAGARFRRQVLVFFGLVLFGANLGYGALESTGTFVLDHGTMLLHGLGIWSIIGAYTVWKRSDLFRNHANGALFSIAIVSFIGLQAFWISTYALGIPFRTALSLSAVFYVLPGCAVSVLLSARFALSPVVAALGLLAAAFWPEHAWTLIGVSAGAALGLVGLAFRPDAPVESARA